MKKNNLKVSTRIIITGMAQISIVPNAAVVPDRDPSFQTIGNEGFSPNGEILKGLRKMAELNGREFAGGDPLIEIVFTQDSIFDEDPTIVEMDGVKYKMRMDTGSYIPYSYIGKLKEYKSVKFNIPVSLYSVESDEKVHSAVWEAEIRANQNRYTEFGSFERVMKLVMSASHKVYAKIRPHGFVGQDYRRMNEVRRIHNKATARDRRNAAKANA